ncbi:MAG: hypothetical protein QMC83_01705 [Thermodesulfovibrionales bacterium]|nr:hypothetical protein [Thermodesulfovibrionales bacterium]
MTNIFQLIYSLISNPLLLLNLTLLFAVTIVVLPRWRNGIILIFIWLYLEDIIRRLLPGQPPHVMLIKDGLLLLTYFAFFVTLVIKQNNRSPFILWKPPFIIGFLIFGGWCVVGTVNPHLPSPLFAAIGLRSYLWYVPILFLGYYMFSRERGLMKFCRILVYTSIPLTIIAIIQYIFYDLISPLIRPLEGAHQFHSFGLLEGSGIKLVPSIFRSAAVYSLFTLLLFFLGMGLRFYPHNSPRQRFFINISILFAAVGVFMSGVRAPMYLLIFGTLGYMFTYKRDFPSNVWSRRKSILLPIALLSIGVFLIIYLVFQDISKYFIHSPHELLPERSKTLTQDILFAVENSGFLGFGTGSRSQGLQYIPEGEEWAVKDEWGVEGIFAKIWYELGPIGELIFIFFFAQMFLSWLKERRKLKGTTLYSLGLAICMYLVLISLWSIKGHQIFGDATTLVCFWFFMGVLFRLKNFANQETRYKKDGCGQST